MIDNATAIHFYYTVHDTFYNAMIPLAFLGGIIVGAIVIAFIGDYEVRQLRISGRKLGKLGVYTFTKHTPETMQEYLDLKKKEKELS